MKRSTKAAAALVPAALLTLGVTIDHAVADGGGNNEPGARVSGMSHARGSSGRAFAVVNADGSKLRGKFVASTTKLSTGTYDVRFTKNITKCAWTGTVGLGGFSGSTGPGMVTATGRNGTNNGLFVETYNGSGTLTDEPFLVVVVCS